MSRLSVVALSGLAAAGLFLAGGRATAASTPQADGDLYFVNLTQRAASLTLDSEAHAPAQVGEVQGRSVAKGPHVLHIAADGWPPQDVKVDFDADHVAQDETGLPFWCVVAVVDAQALLRIVPFEPGNCSKLVAMGLHPALPGPVPPELKGDIYFINESGQPAGLAVDGNAPVTVQDRTVFGYSIPPGGHDLHLTSGAARSVDLHLNFDARNIGRDDSGSGYWCVAAGTRQNVSLSVFQLDAPACTKLVAPGRGPAQVH